MRLWRCEQLPRFVSQIWPIDLHFGAFGNDQIATQVLFSWREDFPCEICGSLVSQVRLKHINVVLLSEGAIVRRAQSVIPDLIRYIFLIDSCPPRQLFNLRALVEHIALIYDARSVRHVIDERLSDL